MTNCEGILKGIAGIFDQSEYLDEVPNKDVYVQRVVHKYEPEILPVYAHKTPTSCLHLDRLANLYSVTQNKSVIELCIRIL